METRLRAHGLYTRALMSSTRPPAGLPCPHHPLARRSFLPPGRLLLGGCCGRLGASVQNGFPNLLLRRLPLLAFAIGDEATKLVGVKVAVHESVHLGQEVQLGKDFTGFPAATAQREARERVGSSDADCEAHGRRREGGAEANTHTQTQVLTCCR